MTSDAPGPVTPGSGQAPEPASSSGEWPPELVPPPAMPVAPAGSATWGAPPTPAQAPVPQQPQAWGAAAAPPPAGGGWGAPPAEGQPPAPGQPPAQPAGRWGTPPAQPGGQWATPPAQPPAQPGWAPVPGVPGAPPPGSWNPQPAKSGNGCLKACLIVGVILVVIGIIGVIGITVLGMKFAESVGVNPDGSRKACELISTDDLRATVGRDAEAMPMGGLVDSTIGQLLDQRILKDAPDCWIIGSSDTSVTGRLARQDGGDTSGDFRKARQAAQDAGYFAGDVRGFGDEAFCTNATEVASFGILVRSGGRLAYVSLIDPRAMQDGGFETGPNGEMTSPRTCALAGAIAKGMLK